MMSDDYIKELMDRKITGITVEIGFDKEGFMEDLKCALDDEFKKFIHYNLEDYITIGKSEDKCIHKDMAEFYRKCMSLK